MYVSLPCYLKRLAGSLLRLTFLCIVSGLSPFEAETQSERVCLFYTHTMHMIPFGHVTFKKLDKALNYSLAA